MKNTIRGMQGDVQFRTIKVLPKEAVKINHKPIALGEHSGHEHIVTGDVELLVIMEQLERLVPCFFRIIHFWDLRPLS